jgi:hypothetical protein
MGLQKGTAMSRPKGKRPTNRRLFVGWLEQELRQAGAKLEEPLKFDDMRREAERLWVIPIAKMQGRINGN